MLIRSLNILGLFILRNSIGVLGKPNTYVEPKIINGTIAWPEENTFQVSVRLKDQDWLFGSGHICGGALIKPSVILTAAHCIYNAELKVMRRANEFVVSMGSMNRFDRLNSTAFEILEIHYKKTFSMVTFVDDIALMIMNGLVPETYKNIKPIAINWNAVPDETICKVSGWGVKQNGFTSDLLMIVNVPIVNNTVCAENYNGSVKVGMICAGYLNGLADACDGDSGGPLVCNGKLSGIVSFGVGCAIKNLPGVYTDLSYHSKWIKNLTERDHLTVTNTNNSAIDKAPTFIWLVMFLVFISRELPFK